jgi:hypothetical protein
MSPEELQRQWHLYLVSHWKYGFMTVSQTVWRFKELFPEAPTGDWTVGIEWMRANGITTLPPLYFAWAPLGAWMFAAWPQFVDEVAKAKDAKTIDLGKLKFISTPKLVQTQSKNARRMTLRKEREWKLEKVALARIHKGNQNKLRGK